MRKAYSLSVCVCSLGVFLYSSSALSSPYCTNLVSDIKPNPTVKSKPASSFTKLAGIYFISKDDVHKFGSGGHDIKNDPKNCPSGTTWYAGSCKKNCDTNAFPYTDEPDKKKGSVVYDVCQGNIRFGYKSCNNGWILNGGKCDVNPCSGYNLTSYNASAGAVASCKSGDTMKYKYTSCNSGWDFVNGNCNVHSCNAATYPYANHPGSEAGTVTSCKSGTTTKYGYSACNNGWDKVNGYCNIHTCDTNAYPYTSAPSNAAGTVTSCKTGTTTKYGYSACNNGWTKSGGRCNENACTGFNSTSSSIANCKTTASCKKGNSTVYQCSACKDGYTANATTKVCEIKNYATGDIYYYNGTAIGVVFSDDGNVIKILALKNINKNGQEVDGYNWKNCPSWHISTEKDVGTLSNCYNENVAAGDMDGRSNTQKLLAYAKDNNMSFPAATATSMYAPSVCPEGSFCGKGEWYLPALGELKQIYSKLSTIQNKLTSAGGRRLNADFSGLPSEYFRDVSWYWSSSEYKGYVAWYVNLYEGIFATRTKSEGWNVRPALAIYRTCPVSYVSNAVPENCDITFSCVEQGTATTKYKCALCKTGYDLDETTGKCKKYDYTVGDVYKYNGTPIGVVFYNDGKMMKIVGLKNINSSGVEPAEAGNACTWWANSSDYSWSTGATQTKNVTAAFNDMNGKINTQEILAYAKAHNKTVYAATATSLYAPSVCPAGSICGQGKWYLPAAGEFLKMYNRLYRIDTALGNTGGTRLDNESASWSSTEYDSDKVWMLRFDDGDMITGSKDVYYYYVRPALEIKH